MRIDLRHLNEIKQNFGWHRYAAFIVQPRRPGEPS